MPVYILYSSRAVFRACIFFIFIAGFFLFSHPTYADPHAVFYTDRAQEQVFFNTLAALNQADFVEPGIPGQPFSRTNLVDSRRAAVAKNLQTTALPDPTTFGAEQNPLIAETKTDLPAILTRSITLEGHDLWTAYLVHQFALETATRRSTSELARVFCERGLGRAGCINEPGVSQQQDTAFVTEPSEHVGQEGLAIAAILSSGDAGERDFQDKLTGTKKMEGFIPNDPIGTATNLSEIQNEPPVPESLKFPRPSDTELAALRKNTAGTDALNIVNNTTASLLASQYSSGLDPNAFSKVSFENNGKVTVPKDISFDDYLDTVEGIGSLLPGSITIAEKGRETAEEFNYYRENPLALADYKLTKDEGGGVKATITTSSTAKDALVREGAALASNLAINQKFANPEAIDATGQTDLVPRVAGASTKNDPSNDQGKVAGVSEVAVGIYNVYKNFFDQPSPVPKSPDDNLISPQRESGVYDLLQALTDDTYRKGAPNTSPEEQNCGFCTQFNNVIQGAGNVVQGIYTDVYCVLFPTVEGCKLRKP